MKARIDADERNRMVAEAAYFRAERRGFAGGDPLADWVEAEAEVEAALSVQHAALHEHRRDASPSGEARGGEAGGRRAEPHGQPHGEPHGQRHDEPHGQHRAEPHGQHHGELLARIEDGVAEAGKKVEALRKKAGDVESTARAEVQQQLDRIAELREALETRRNEIRQQGELASRSLLEQAESLWNELTAFLSRKAPATRRRSSRRK